MVTLTSRTLKSGNLVTWRSQRYCILRLKELLLWSTQSREVVFSGKEKWIELEINISVGRSSHLTAIYKKRPERKLLFERRSKWWWTNTNKYWWTKRREILMKQISVDHFFEKSSSMNALIVANSNVKLETRLLWNRVGHFSTINARSTLYCLVCSTKANEEIFNDQQCCGRKRCFSLCLEFSNW